ncbi:MAG: hypothetical protein H0U74_22195 [Bradymonadaceae bacterium]|nr:hypothetical protein [Lujinxingiaceae bacterium]
MKMRNLSLALVVGLALAAAPVVGCGPDARDPSNKGTNNKNNTNPDTGTTNNTDPDTGVDNNTDPDTGSNNSNNTDPDTGGNNTDPDLGGNDTDPDVTTDPDECTAKTTFFGQIGGTGPHDGGSFTTDAIANAAGLKAVLDAFIVPTPNTEICSVATPCPELFVCKAGTGTPPGPSRCDYDGQRFETAMPVSGATVIATSFVSNTEKRANRQFWLQDSETAIQVFLAAELPVNVKVGQKVSFGVNAIKIFGGHPQITGIEGFTIDTENHPVPYTELSGQDVTMAHYGKNVRVGGVVGANPEECGGSSKCYELRHGGKTVILRSASRFLLTGDCVTYVGPLSSFPGPKSDGALIPTAQLDTINFSWLDDPPAFD